MKKFEFFNRISTKITMSFSLTFVAILLVLNFIIFFSIRSHLFIIEKGRILDRKELIIENINGILGSRRYDHITAVNMFDITGKSDTHRDEIFVNFRFPDTTFRRFKKFDLSFYTSMNTIVFHKYEKLEKNLKNEFYLMKDNYIYLNTVLTTDNGQKIYIQLINNMNSSYSLLETLISTMLLIDLIGFILAIIVGVLFAKNTLKPINLIADTAELINLHNLNKRITTSNHDDEIGRLIKVMNDMMERLEISFENQTKFISDASHELRTPLSIINGYVELLIQQGTSNRELTIEALSSIKEEVFNMTDLMEKLLFIAREENTRYNIDLVEVNIKVLLNRIVKEFKMIDKKHQYILKPSSDFIINIDEKLILQAIRAIIENSIKYTPKGNSISIYFLVDDSNLNILIEDEGIGISKKHLPKLFGRFYRVDEARTKNTGGNGLGLSIVKSIMDMHNGKIVVESQINIGTTIILKLPLQVII